MKTKYKLIKLPDSTIVVSDEEIEETFNGLIFQKGTNKIHNCTRVEFKQNGRLAFFDYENLFTPLGNCEKIIAGLQNLPAIKYNLSDEDAKGIGFIDVEKLANSHKVTINDVWSYSSFMAGFKKSIELNDKKFSEADMVSFLYFSDSYKSKHGYKSNEELIDIWKSQQTKIFDCNCEIELKNNCVTVTKIL